MELTKSIINKIRILREVNNYTQEYVAFYLDISHNTYSLLEKGKGQLTISRVNKLAKLYNIDLCNLIKISENDLMENSIGLGKTQAPVPAEIPKDLVETLIMNCTAIHEKLEIQNNNLNSLIDIFNNRQN